MIDKDIVSLLEEGVDYMYDRCHHFNIIISNKYNYKFIISSSIRKEYNKILENKSYDSIQHTYFIGVKENTNTLMQGLRGRYEIIHEEPLYPYSTDSKHGRKMTSGDPIDAVKDAMSSHSDYKKGTWLDLLKLWTDFKSISNNIFNEDTIHKKITFWDDGTYKFQFSKDNLSEEHKKMIRDKIPVKDKDTLEKIYNDTTLECIYYWHYNTLKKNLFINSIHNPEDKFRYTIKEYDISTNFHYIEPLAKSDYLFDYR